MIHFSSVWNLRPVVLLEMHAALVIFLSLAVFDRVKAEGLAASAEPDARNAPDLAARPRLRVTRSEIAIHEFGRHRHHDQSKNPAHHTTGSKLAPRRAVLKFDLDAVHVGGPGSRRGRPHRCARLRGGAHSQLPGGEGAAGPGP
jgi:hypothetical protein